MSSRFEGRVYRIFADGTNEVMASDLGVACGLAFGADGTLYVGDRAGTIFKIEPGGRTEIFATIPSSIAAFHLAMSPVGQLFVAAPTLASYDSVRRIDPDGRVEVLSMPFGRPQGLAFDVEGNLYVAASLNGHRGIVRITPDGRKAEIVVAGSSLVGLAFAAASLMWRFWRLVR